MGRTEPPFLYDPPSRHDFPPTAMGNFNPRARTQESWASSPPRPQRNAPLINFNRHPDSYAVIPTGRVNTKTMSPGTKGRVKYTRYVQLVLRLFTLVGALGVLFCVICIKDTTTVIAWLIRVAPGVSILHTLYGIYHLCRRAAGRTPGSSAGYMLFASVLDAGLIPLYVLTAILAKVEHRDQTYNWGTLFETPLAADKIFYSTFLACSVVGGLHLASLVIDLYLAIIFRKIAKLPPDMNPLEDNLTSRPHKHSKSEIAEKHLSGSTAVSSNGNRDSLAQDPLIIPTRPVQFMHTRENSDATFCNSQDINDEQSSYYSARSHRHSRADLPSQVLREYEQNHQPKPAIARTAAQRRGTPSRPQSVIIDTPPTSEPSGTESAGVQLRDPSGVSSLTMDNWFTYPSEPPSPLSHTGETLRGQSPNRQEDEGIYDIQQDLDHSSTLRRSKGPYAPLQFYSDDENLYDKAHTNNLFSAEFDLGENEQKFMDEESNGGKTRMLMNPLELNPPTPRPPEPDSNGNTSRAALTDLPNPSVSSGRSTPVNNSDRNKSRSYGGLGQNTPPAKRDMDPQDGDSPHTATPSKSAKKRWRRKSGRVTAYESLKADDEDSDVESENPATPGETDRKGRVVSNTGIDLGLGFGSGSPGYSSYIAGLGVGRRRDVSGKMAEEGRGGEIGNGENEAATRPVQPRKLSKSKTGDIKAAGWARWRGL